MPAIFVTCASTLEPILAEELREMGYANVVPQFRGVTVPEASMEDVIRINYNSRIASRVLLPIYSFRCYDSQSLYREASSINWSRYIKLGKTFAIDANVQHPNLRNSLFAAQVVKDAICDQFRKATGDRPTVQPRDPDIQLNLFIHRQQAIISFDSSGTPLHKRGYRQDTVEAPMRESLAAALLKLAQYDKEKVLYDPCCGSGTLLIEAALIASQTAPGYLRTKWGFFYHPNFDQKLWLQVKAEADQRRQKLVKGHFFGTDVNKAAVHSCRLNLRAAGFHDVIEITQQDFREHTPSKAPTLLITNPPHGKRMESISALQPLYRSLGDFMRSKMSKPSSGFVFTQMDLSKEIGLAATQRHVIDHAGIDSRLLHFDIYPTI